MKNIAKIRTVALWKERLEDFIKIHKILNGIESWDATKLFDLVSRTRGDATIR